MDCVRWQHVGSAPGYGHLARLHLCIEASVGPASAEETTSLTGWAVFEAHLAHTPDVRCGTLSATPKKPAKAGRRVRSPNST